MNQSSYDILSGVVEELKKEYIQLQEKIDDYTLQIKEADCYIQSFYDKEDEDFRIFSPRNVDDLYGEDIAKSKSNINAIQQQLNKCYHRQNILRSRIDKLNCVIDQEQGFHVDSNSVKKNLSILSIQEQDRQRIARDLHDTSLQNLAHLVHKIELSGLFIDQDPIRAKLELVVISKNLKAVIDEVRNTIFDLRPMSFDDLGLKPAFEQLVQKVKEDHGIEVAPDIDTFSHEDDLVLATIFRVVQECFVNIVKHSEAKKIIFNCKMKDCFCVIDIVDDGKGFTKSEVEDKKDRHFGISVMKERISLLGGEIRIDSEKDKGTHIHIEIPLVQVIDE